MKPNYNININLESQDLDIVLLFQIKEKVERLSNKKIELNSKQIELLKIDKKSFEQISKGKNLKGQIKFINNLGEKLDYLISNKE